MADLPPMPVRRPLRLSHASRFSRAPRVSALLVAVAVGSVALGGAALGACAKNDSAGSTTTTGDEAGSAAESDGGAALPDDGATADQDAGTTQPSGEGGVAAPCAFNRECSAALRCECSEAAGCACAPGARGTGKNGIDPCTDGNGCTSSVCTEGPPDAGSFCSDECVTSADCKGKLPVCADIAFVGRICIRQAP